MRFGRGRHVAVVIGLLLLAVITLRGTLPEDGPANPDQPGDSSPAALAGVLLLLSASMLIVAVALLTRPPRPEPGGEVEERRFPGGTGQWPIRRMLLLAVGVAMACVLAFVVLNQLQQLSLPGTAGPPKPPPDRPDGSPAMPRPRAGDGADDGADNPVLRYLAMTVAAMAALMVLSAGLDRLRRRRSGASAGDLTAAAAHAAPESLAFAAERGLAEVEDHSRSPREAIIACYVAMERALAGAPGSAPQESDTPSEVLERAVANRTLRADSATTLVGLFAEARFSTHTMSESHRGMAERALRAVLDEIRVIR